MNKTPETAADLIETTIYDLRVDAAFLRIRSRDEANRSDAETLRKAAEQISRLTSQLERVIRN